MNAHRIDRIARVALSSALGLLSVMALGGCHGGAEMTPLIERKMYLTDRFYDVETLSPKHAFLVGYGGKILETKDGGRNWERRNSGTTNALYKALFTDEKVGWIVGQGGLLLKTSDGGQSWSEVKTGTDRYLFNIAAASPNHLFAIGEGSTMVESTDGGATWTVRKHERNPGETLTEDEAMIVQDPSFYDIKFVDDQTGWIVGEFGYILKTSDGGKTWTEQQKPLIGGEFTSALDLPTFYGVDFIDAQNGIVVGLNGRIARTTDGGQMWKFDQVPEGETAPLFEVKLFKDGSAWAVGASGQAMHRDAGGEWKHADLGMRIHSWMRDVNFFDESNGWIVGGFGLVLYTRDGGKTWIPAAA